MVRAVEVTGSGAPHELAEDYNEKKEEDGDDLKEEDSAESPEGPDEAA